MTFGIILSLYNHLFHKDWVSILNEFVPQMLFMQSIFGYLVIMIVYKWCVHWTTPIVPSLLTMLIDMFLSPGNVKPDYVMYSGQSSLQVLLLLIAVICIPWMLLVKPFILRHRYKVKMAMRGNGYGNVHEDEDATRQSDHASTADSTSHGHGHGEEEFEFGEIFVHQVIHTIEFCLGCVSNTASYLRLWALSLAHAQLSDVLWSMTIATFYGIDGFLGGIGLVVGFAAWFTLTICILLVMEGLSAFLHALRLHWVEFNNKFYRGDGYSFRPFSFDTLRDEDSD